MNRPSKQPTKQPAEQSQGKVTLEFDDNKQLAALFGQHDENLTRIEQLLGVAISARGNHLVVEGEEVSVLVAEMALHNLYAKSSHGKTINLSEVDDTIRMIEPNVALSRPARGKSKVAKPKDQQASKQISIKTVKRVVTPRSVAQADFMLQLLDGDLVFAVGPAGTGKTYLAVAMAVEKMVSGEVDRIILSRPAVEAGESLGFLPGDLKEKVDPYLRPLYDALYDMLPEGLVEKYLASGQIEIAPLAFMRGRTLANSYVILDEAQNTTPMQMKMFLTRFGENSRMAVVGDITQKDLPHGQMSGLQHAVDILDGDEGVAVTRFSNKDIVRHPLVVRIVDAYEKNPVENQQIKGRRNSGSPTNISSSLSSAEKQNTEK